MASPPHAAAAEVTNPRGWLGAHSRGSAAKARRSAYRRTEGPSATAPAPPPPPAPAPTPATDLDLEGISPSSAA